MRDVAIEQAANHLREAAIRLEHDPYNLGIEVRARIERDIFLSAKRLASIYAHYDLHGFAGDSKESLEAQLNKIASPLWVRDLLTRAFELKAALSKLASSDAYVSQEIVNEFSSGRTEAVRLFAGRLKKYSLLLAESPLGEG